MASVTITHFGLQTGTDRKIYATWNWSWKNTKGYNVRWYYRTAAGSGNGNIWFVGKDTEITLKQDTYDAPSNATQVRFVVKPISTTYTKKTKSGSYEVNHWTADWSTKKIYTFATHLNPDKPSAPAVTLKDYLLTASLDNLDSKIGVAQFQIVKDNTTLFKTAQADITKGHVEYSSYVDAGSVYKVRCRVGRLAKVAGNARPALGLSEVPFYSEWSDYSSNVSTIPSASSGFTKCMAKTATSVYLEWAAVNTAETYDIEYATQIDYFDSSDKTQTITGIETTRYEKTGLEDGGTYFFRLRAVNSSGKSPWSEISSVVVGKAPAAPTTWSSTTTIVTGEPLVLYWVHNSEDGSSQTKAELEITINNTAKTYTIQNSIAEDEKDKTSSYTLNTSGYLEGGKILWRVRTAGVTGSYGDWSVQRTVDIYTPPTLTLSMTDVTENAFTVLTSFPIKIKATAGPTSQRAIGYHLSITANGSYETVDAIGNEKIVNKGDTIYSRYFDNTTALSTTLSAGDISLENNASYIVTCVVSMNSGLTAESSLQFVVGWSDEEECLLDCKIAIDMDTYAVAINPFCIDANEQYVDNVTLAVYRREYNGAFTEIVSGVENVENMFVSDPHPSLDYARYRIVATSKTTGQVMYYDAPAQPIGGKAAIIQWDEVWSDFDATIDDTLASPVWSGSMLQLPYNIDVSDSNSRDVELVEYIGREHPITYYGTQLGITQTWKTDIPKSDVETIYALRRLQNWMGDVYIREPSGSGYWANVDVSFNINHKAVVIPVSISIKRVEGGI